jgi:DNA invertase Pin-like site-specific DNA recombinase
MNPAPNPLRVLGYVRVSTGDQVTSGAGLEVQRETLAAAAKQRGWDLVDVVADEGESGGKSFAKRPGLSDLLRRLEAGEADALAVSKLDRLSRSVGDLLNLVERSQPKGRRKGWGLVLLDIDLDTSTPQGSFVLQMMASVAELERKIIGQRTRDALAVKRAQGVRLGRPSTLDAKTVAKIVRWHEEGISLSGITRLLTFEKIPTAHGGARWHASTISKVLQGQDAAKLAG